MKRYISYLFLVITLSGISACTKNFEKYNTDQNKATDQDLDYDNLRIGSLISQMQAKVIPSQSLAENADVNTYQLINSLMGDIYSGHQGASNAFGNNGVNNTTYSMIPGWYGAAFPYAYQNAMAPWYTIRKEAQRIGTGANSAYAIAQIIKVMAMHRVSDIYGPLPYLNFVPASNIPYNSQQDIYNSFFAELDSAILNLKDMIAISGTTSQSLKPYDLIYKGNLTKWYKFANTLKLRLAMRIVYADATNAKKYAEEAAAAGVLSANDDNAVLQVNGVNTLNPLYIISYSYNDTRMGATMESFLKGYKDPRLPLLFNEATGNISGDYHGIRNGSRFSGQAYSPFSTLNVTAATTIQWMTAAESYFLRAEGAIRGWQMGITAKEAYESGVKMAFSMPMGGGQRSAGDATVYLANSTNKPAAYVDPMNSRNNFSGTTNSPLSTVTIRWEEADNFERKLERIVTQKWIALYPDGQEAWSEFRRTRYPRIIPIATNLSNGLINSDIQIRRSPFPQSEYQNNNTNVTVGISLLGGADNGATRLWWDKK
ncbi:SusD/RagB family nutrient-binding outer membrane lipoprotein [Sphingobacterium spiritivorum]|uniref:SusD/RagB family nutrient-binding outer membrane lipoprotein n=1 Tax=Sphingobacterium spiritivorum TaxID=258 RepID=UPI003DA2748F